MNDQKYFLHSYWSYFASLFFHLIYLFFAGTHGKNICSCVPFYQGEECSNIVCLNGGKEMGRRCACPPNFHGFHCEVYNNANGAISKFRAFTEQASKSLKCTLIGQFPSYIFHFLFLY